MHWWSFLQTLWVAWQNSGLNPFFQWHIIWTDPKFRCSSFTYRVAFSKMADAWTGLITLTGFVLLYCTKRTENAERNNWIWRSNDVGCVNNIGRWLTANYQDKRIENEEKNVEYYGINVHESDENRSDCTWKMQITNLKRHGPWSSVKK